MDWNMIAGEGTCGAARLHPGLNVATVKGSALTGIFTTERKEG